VSNVGHTGRGIITSDEGIRSVFDYEFNPVDTDGDGLSDWQEWLAGTDPRLPSEVPVLSFQLSCSTSAVLSWHAKASRRYELQSAETLDNSWRQLSSAISTNDTIMSNTVPILSTESFFRFRVCPQ